MKYGGYLGASPLKWADVGPQISADTHGFTVTSRELSVKGITPKWL